MKMSDMVFGWQCKSGYFINSEDINLHIYMRRQCLEHLSSGICDQIMLTLCITVTPMLTMANSEDPEEMPHDAVFLQGLHCLIDKCDLQKAKYNLFVMYKL